MIDDRSTTMPFSLAAYDRAMATGRLKAKAGQCVESVLGLAALNRMHAALLPTTDPVEFCRASLDALSVRIDIDDIQLRHVTPTGPLVIVANHPFGAPEGLALPVILHRARPDFRLMANYLLQRIPALRTALLCVDPFGGADAARWYMTGNRRRNGVLPHF